MSYDRIAVALKTPEEIGEVKLRPQFLDDFIGQEQLKYNLKIFITAAKYRNESLDHLLFYGPPGLGKTTLSQIIAQEMGVNIKMTSGPMIAKTGELAAILTNLQNGDVLFIDEIHRLSSAVEELLYSAMEDFCLDLIIGEGPAARTVKIHLPKFTLIGATTRLGMLSNPLRDRFGIPLKLEFYSIRELEGVVIRVAQLMKMVLSDNVAQRLAQCSRGTPRIAIRLLKRVRDFVHHNRREIVDLEIIAESLAALGIDSLGLDKLDYNYIHYLIDHYRGGPVGIETIAAGLSEDRDSIEDVIEPYLMQIGFVARTARGRVLTESCMQYVQECRRLLSECESE